MDGVLGIQVILELCRNLVGAVGPDGNDLLGTVVVTQKTSAMLCIDLVDLCFCICKESLFLFGDNGIKYGNRDTAAGGISVALVLQIIKHSCCNGGTVYIDALFDDFAELLLFAKLVNLGSEHADGVRGISLDEAEILRDGTIENHTAECGINKYPELCRE